jgi:2-keto-myo-inositol isomerase
MEHRPPTYRFALNHMAAPRLGVSAFFALARELGIRDVEIRNDLSGTAISDGTEAETVRAAASDAGVAIATINALQRFNDWTAERAAEATALADYACACGAKALVLVPVNDGSKRANGERQGHLRVALKGLFPILAERGIGGLVEPLGFESSSLRSKDEAVSAIEALGLGDTFRLVHDTFHHHLAGEPALFPGSTGMVHISGVNDPTLEIAAMRDPHRLLVGERDRLDNVGQIAALLSGGYSGLFSFEPFAPEIQALPSPATALRESMDFVRKGVLRAAA